MTGAGSKNKGSSFERFVCQSLSKWLTAGARNDVLRRTVGSGGQFTRAKSTKGEPGDIGPNDPLAFEFMARFVIECKHWKKLDLIDNLWDDKHALMLAVNKVRGEARGLNREWMLIARQNHRPTLLFIAATPYLKCLAQNKIQYHALFGGTVLLMRFEDFVESIPVPGVTTW